LSACAPSIDWLSILPKYEQEMNSKSVMLNHDGPPIATVVWIHKRWRAETDFAL
jgi:hypothetical protein